MATSILLSDAELDTVKTTFATYFSDPGPFRKQVTISRRVSIAVAAIGGATSSNAPNKWQFVNLVAAFDDLGNGDYSLADFMASRPTTPSMPEAAKFYHTSLDKKFVSLAMVQMKLFNNYPTHVISSLVENDKLVRSIDSTVKSKVASAMQTAISKGFVIGKDSMEALIADSAYASSAGSSDAVKSFLRKLARLVVLVRLPQDLKFLWDTPYDSATSIAHTPQNSFVTSLAAAGMTEESAVAIHDHAGMIDLRNEQAWTALLASRSQWAPATMSSSGASSSSTTSSTASTGLAAQLINYTNLFGDVYINPCDDCSSVTSPAAYFVDLLRMLKNCPSDPKNASSASLLAKLLERRPDINDIQLTCSNTNILIPYIDLANEVMESFIANLAIATNSNSSTTTIPIRGFNMTDNDNNELNTSQPQQTQFSVYRDQIDKQVFPLDVFPYNQAIDTIRSYATAFGASRYDIMTTFQSKYRLRPDPNVASGTSFERADKVLKYSRAAESLNLQPSDHVAITASSTYPRSYFADAAGQAQDQTTYETAIGLRTAQSYWGFASPDTMLSETDGLPNVAKQFLMRANMTLQELLDLLKTRFAGGRLILGNTSDAPIFDTNILDLRLRHPSASNPRGSLTPADCFALQAFIRLWRKSNWSLFDIDLALSYFSDQTGAAETMPLITADSIDCLSAVQELQKLTGYAVEELMPLWGLMDTFGGRPLYARLFLQGNPSRPDAVFGRDSRGRFLTDTQMKLSQNRAAVAAALGIADEHFSAVLWAAQVQNDVLNLANVSAMYRARLLCTILEIDPLYFSAFLTFFGPGFSPFKTPRATIQLVKEWRACVAQNISLQQILFITGTDQLFRLENPGYGLSDQVMVALVFRILIGLMALDQTYPLGSNIPTSLATVAEIIRVANLVFDPEISPQVSNFIEGVGTTPRLLESPIYQNILLPYFKANESEARSVLFEQPQPSGTAEDIAVGLETQSINRRLLFLRAVTPSLKTRLTGELMVDCMTSLVPDNDPVMARTLAANVVRSTATADTASQVLTRLLDTNTAAPGGVGPSYFRAPSTDTFSLSFADASSSAAPQLIIDGVPITWTAVTGGWVSNELKLSLGQTYALKTSTSDFSKFSFSNTRSIRLPFSSDVLLYPKTLQDATDIILPLLRAAEFIRAFQLDIPTIGFMYGQATKTTMSVNFSQLTYNDVKKAQRYNNLRDATSATEMYVIEYFQWVTSQDLDTSLADKLSGLTGIPRLQIEGYLKAKFPTLAPAALMDIFCNDFEILSLLTAYNFSSNFSMSGVGFDLLFKWATPLEPSVVSQYYDHAAEIRRIVLMLPRVDADNDPIVKANDIIRVNQREALMAYLLQQSWMQSRGILTSGNLFEFFLIDVQMNPGLRTSRIKQAISTIQLYTQRCILGLEVSRGISSVAVNIERWTWMRKYRLWEANRKVFLYPENWLEPSLRDNKSEVFQALEAGILQVELNEESIKSLIRDYIYGANQVVDLSIQAYSWDRRSDEQGTLHFFGRTKQAPYKFYYRNATVSGVPSSALSRDSFTRWTPWSEINVDIPTIETDSNATLVSQPGSYLVPAVRDQRLFLFIPQLMLKTVSDVQTATSTKSYTSLAGESPRQHVPKQVWHIQMAWTELRNGSWAPKVIAPSVLTVSGAKVGDWTSMQVPVTTGVWAPCTGSITLPMWDAATLLPSVSTFRFTTYTRPGDGDLSVITIVVDRWISVAGGTCYRYPCGAFELRGESLVLLDRDAFEQTTYAVPFVPTVPTNFNRFVWSGGSASTAPDYRITAGGSTPSKLLWAMVPTSANKPSPKATYTMSFDQSRFASAVHGLVVELQWPNINQTLFNQVKLAGKTDNNYDVSTSEEMSNTMWPLVLNAITTSSTIDKAYTLLSRNIAQERQHQLFGTQNMMRNESSMPAAIYSWELGVHIIMLLMERLRDLQQWDLAIRVARYVFDPTIDGSNLGRCWGFFPFQEIANNPQQSIEALLKSLSSSSGAESTMSPNILASRQSPFNAHIIARGRPIAYMKRMVMTYIEILIGSGDDYFRQNTLETVPLAIQNYIEASHLYGSAPAPLPQIGRRAPCSYKQLEALFNDFSNTSFDLELDFPFWCDPSKRGGTVTDTSPSYSLTGMLRSTYFCVPTNPKLLQLKGLIEDRLFKIRNCQDINGVTRSLSLFEPPIDVGAAMKAMTAGIRLDILLNDSVGPMPNIRFASLLESALDMCGELKNMGAAFQAIKETRDAEALAAVQAKQDRVMQEMTMTTKVLAKQEISKSIEELLETRKSHVTRLRYLLDLTGDTKEIPNETSEWDDIVQEVEKPVNGGSGSSSTTVLMTKRNQQELNSMVAAKGAYGASVVTDAIALTFKAIPECTSDFKPLGVGFTIGAVTQAVADSVAILGGILRTGGDIAMMDASTFARNSDFVTQAQDRRMEANATGRDIKIVDRQIATLRVSLDMCAEDIRQQKQMIEHAAQTSDFLRSKYTSEQLYIWMDGQIRNLFYQTYLLANDLAKKAQKAYRYERCSDDTEYVAQSYWNANRDGLLSGEQLYLALKRLETAYNKSKGHDFEITKAISLRSIQPLAIVNLRESGVATFSIPEVVFDFDFPGHYMRRIKTLSVSITAASDIGSEVDGTLRLLDHRYRTVPRFTNAADYPMKSTTDDRFDTSQVPITAIAVSQPTDDSGVFDYELEFNDYQRYVPFEGAGVISKWQFELATTVKQFDFSQINDVVIKLKYTSVNGGVALRKAASDATKTFQTSVANLSASEGLFTVIELPKDYTSQWSTLSAKSANTRSVTLSSLQSRLPYFTKGRTIKVETITALISATSSATWTSGLTLSGQSNVTWKAAADVGQFKAITATGLAERFTDWTVGLTQGTGNAGLQNLIFIVRYLLA